MRGPHLLRVEEGPERFAVLIEAARAAGLRVGWLELRGVQPRPVPADLERAASAGALRAVAVGEERSVVIKPMRGAPVLRDLLREHFRGCALVLVRGGESEVEAPALRVEDGADGERWLVTAPEQAARAYELAALVAELRRPHPWLQPPQDGSEGAGG